MNSENIFTEQKIKPVKSKIDSENIKSNYILKKILNLIPKNKLLNILKYNKNLQKRLNLSINDYKDSSHLYSSIESK